MTYCVNLCDNPHMSEDDVHKGEQAAMKSLQRYPEWLLRAAYKDDHEMLEAGIPHAERGESAWRRIEDEAYEALRKAIGMDKWHDPYPAGMHIEVFFSKE